MGHSKWGVCADNGAASSSYNDACAVFRRASRAITQLYDLVLAPTGLKATQFIVLRAISDHGEVAQWRLANEHGLAVETLSRRLASLRGAGLVTQRIGSARHRERLYRLTDAGEQKVRAALPYWERATERLRIALGAAQWDTVMLAAQQAAGAARQAENLKISAVAKSAAVAVPPSLSSVARTACAGAGPGGTKEHRIPAIT